MINSVHPCGAQVRMTAGTDPMILGSSGELLPFQKLVHFCRTDIIRHNRIERIVVAVNDHIPKLRGKIRSHGELFSLNLIVSGSHGKKLDGTGSSEGS